MNIHGEADKRGREQNISPPVRWRTTDKIGFCFTRTKIRRVVSENTIEEVSQFNY